MSTFCYILEIINKYGLNIEFKLTDVQADESL